MDKEEWLGDWNGEGTPEGWMEYIWEILIQLTGYLNITPEQMNQALKDRLERWDDE